MTPRHRGLALPAAVLRLVRRLLPLGLLAVAAVPGAAQVVTTGAGFVPGGRTLFATDFTQDVVGDFPRGLKLVSGSLDVVERDGIRMLRSTGPAEFLIPLPEVLPAQFTLEFDLVSRATDCCAGEELAVEGSPMLARTPGSAQLLWHHQWVAILGGGKDMGTSTVRLSETLQAELLGQLGRVEIAFEGPSLKLWTNGVRLYNLPEVVFRRSTVLRVFLGGRDDADRAVYLARIRVATGGGPAPAAAAPGAAAPTPAPAPAPAQPAPTPAQGPAPLGGSAVATSPTTVSVSWQAASGVRGYTVERRKVDDPACCIARSGSLSATAWQDSGLQPGVEYVYAISALYQDGRTGETEVGVLTPLPPPPTVTVSRTAALASATDVFAGLPCSNRSAGGVAPAAVRGWAESPAGLRTEWDVMVAGTQYVVERAPQGTTNWVLVASTCGGPSYLGPHPFGLNGISVVRAEDAAGGVTPAGRYVYRVTAVDAQGRTGWNTMHWTAPVVEPPRLRSTVSGSTVILKWDSPRYVSPSTGITRLDPTNYTITSSYGYSRIRYGLNNDDSIYGVPVGTHTFTVVGNYRVGTTPPATITVIVAY